MVNIPRYVRSLRCTFPLLAFLLLLPLTSVAADRQIVSGPYSLSVRVGGENNSDALGFDARVDYLSKMINLHLLGTYDWLDDGRGIGEIDNQKYGAALALSHTYAGKLNAYAGTAFVREMGENFGHAYVGGKMKVADYALVSAAYGFGFGHVKEIRKVTSRFVGAEAVDWLKAGVILANSQGWKANAYYTLTDPGDLAISGVEGELSYPILDYLTAGVRGNADLVTKTDVLRNWSGFAFLTYAFGDQKGNPIDVALEKNNPLVMPIVVRRTLAAASSGSLSVTAAPSPATISCDSSSQFTATPSGPVTSYSWTLSSVSPTGYFVIAGASDQSTVNVSDAQVLSVSASATLTVTVSDGVNTATSAPISITGGCGGV